MSSAEQIVTQAFRLLGALDINEDAPSPNEMKIGLETLTRLIDSWKANSLNINTQTQAGTVAVGSPTVTGLTNAYLLAPSLNASGTGVSARILSIDSVTQITLDANATVSGSPDITFTALPFEAKFERGVIAMFAMDLAPLIGKRDIPKIVVDMAKEGWSNLTANYMVTPPVTFDRDLLFTSIRRDSGVVTGNG